MSLNKFIVEDVALMWGADGMGHSRGDQEEAGTKIANSGK